MQMFTILCHKNNLHVVNLLIINRTLDGGDKNLDSVLPSLRVLKISWQ